MSVPYYRSHILWSLEPQIRHGFFGRRGGTSTGIYNSLNCGAGTDDDLAEAVEDNRRLVMQTLGLVSSPLVTMNQTHSADCVVVESASPEGRIKADALVTKEKSVALGVLTADCVPVLLAGTDKDGQAVIGAAHAGWRGALGGILAATVESMKNLGATRLYAGIGPAIGPESYEVGEDVRRQFVAKDKDNARFFAPDGADKFMFDLPGYVFGRLEASGVTAFNCAIDTYFNEEDYFSYRRATHRDEKDYGRQVSVIAIPSENSRG